ncbi:MAG: hypothetical protein U9O56_01205 [Campylobacterota bacterium]|nr:hypothetical protein [Campylobacterota bacterium]
MVITFYNTKGGSTKTSLATLYSYLYNYPILTNDTLNYVYQDEELLDTKIYKLGAKKNSLNPAIFKANENLICDLSSSMSILDSKIPAILKKTDILVVPTLTDNNSLLVTATTLKMVQKYVQNIHIVVSRIENKRDFEYAKQYFKHLNLPIHAIKKTRLFHRLSQHGYELFEQIHNTNAEWQLKKTLKEIEVVFEEISNV